MAQIAKASYCKSNPWQPGCEAPTLAPRAPGRFLSWLVSRRIEYLDPSGYVHDLKAVRREAVDLGPGAVGSAEEVVAGAAERIRSRNYAPTLGSGAGAARCAPCAAAPGRDDGVRPTEVAG